MPISAVGTASSQYLYFNSGFLTIGGVYNIDLQNVTITENFDIKTYRALNSIKKRALRRTALEQTLKATVKGFSKEALASFYSSSSPIAAGTQYTVKDTSIPNAETITFTGYRDEDQTKRVQYQLVNPMIRSINGSFAVEEFLETEIEIDCTDMYRLADTTADA